VCGGAAQECLDQQPGTLLDKVDVEHVASPATGNYTLAGLLQVVPPPLGSALGAGGRHTRRSLRMEPGGDVGADQAQAAGEPAAAGTAGTDTATAAPTLERKPKPAPRPSRRSGLDMTPGYRALCSAAVHAPPPCARARTHTFGESTPSPPDLARHVDRAACRHGVMGRGRGHDARLCCPRCRSDPQSPRRSCARVGTP